MNTISPNTVIRPVEPLAPQRIRDGAGAAETSFTEHLRAAVTRVEAETAQAEGMMDRFISGEVQDLHSVALATQRASLEFETFLQVRNKVVNAYQEVMRMQL